MSNRITITVDGNTLMDDNMGDWTRQPPDINKLRLGLGQHQPWTSSIMFTLAMTAAANQAGHQLGHTTITVTTAANGWTLAVTKD